MSGEELAAAEANYREMKQRVENMGAVNMMALEEFNECEQRFTFLTRERDDLLKSRSEEHTSELQSRLHLVCRLLLEKKKIPLLDQSYRSPPQRCPCVSLDSLLLTPFELMPRLRCFPTWTSSTPRLSLGRAVSSTQLI